MIFCDSKKNYCPISFFNIENIFFFSIIKVKVKGVTYNNNKCTLIKKNKIKIKY